jgi:hypothetical protein
MEGDNPDLDAHLLDETEAAARVIWLLQGGPLLLTETMFIAPPAYARVVPSLVKAELVEEVVEIGGEDGDTPVARRLVQLTEAGKSLLRQTEQEVSAT